MSGGKYTPGPLERELMTLADSAIHAYATWLAEFTDAAGETAPGQRLPVFHVDRLNTEKDATREMLRQRIVRCDKAHDELVALLQEVRVLVPEPCDLGDRIDAALAKSTPPGDAGSNQEKRS